MMHNSTLNLSSRYPFDSFVSEMNYLNKLLLMFGLVVNLLVVWFVKLHLLWWTYSSRGVGHKPLQLLILADEFKKVAALTFLTIVHIVKLSGSPVLAAPANCWLLYLVQAFGSILLSSRSSIALMRSLYIQRPELVSRVGEYKIMMMLLSTSHILMLLPGMIHGAVVSPRDNWFQYFSWARCSDLRSDIDSSRHRAPIFIIILGVHTLTNHIVELFIYTSVGYFIYQRNVLVKTSLPQQSFARRQRENYMSLLGNFLHFTLVFGSFIFSVAI